MANGVGGSNTDTELAKLTSVRDRAMPIGMEEHIGRLNKLRGLMKNTGTDALYLDATTSLRYFTGLVCYPSERLHAAIVTADELFYVCPAFEEEKTKVGMLIQGDFVLWQEHEDPAAAVADCVLKVSGSINPTLAIDDQTPFFTVDGLQKASTKINIINGGLLIAECRRIKSENELSLLKQAKSITLGVHQSVAKILHAGIDTREVQGFLDDAHVACGMDGRSTFKIVLFGEPTAYPHGVPYPQTLKQGDMVLIDTGATMFWLSLGYHAQLRVW